MLLNGQPQQPSSLKETPEGRREILLQHLVRRFLLQARVPSGEWATRESTLLRFSTSLLDRFPLSSVFHVLFFLAR